MLIVVAVVVDKGAADLLERLFHGQVFMWILLHWIAIFYPVIRTEQTFTWEAWVENMLPREIHDRNGASHWMWKTEKESVFKKLTVYWGRQKYKYINN